MSGLRAAREAQEKYGTSDPFAIAEKAGVSVVYESWYPTTIGEFEVETKTILVNRRALENNKNARELEQIIVAHELGHFFAMDLSLDKTEGEKFAREFAQELTAKEQRVD